MHMWYTITLLTGMHYGTGQRTADISVADSVHAMRCWWLCFLAYSSTITFAKLSLGFFFLRLTSVITLHRVVTIVTTASAVVVGVVYFFLSLFQCAPLDFFWTRLQGAQGKCLSMDIIIGMTYLYGAVAAATDIAFGVLLAALIWRLNVDRRTKVLIAPLLGMACIASYAALVRMPYIQNFKSADFLYSTVDISLWSTVEVGVSVFAANLATLRPLVQHVADSARSLSSRVRGRTDEDAQSNEVGAHELREFDDGKLKISTRVVELPSEAVSRRADGESVISLTRSTRHIEV